jgi:hypothetical protein
MCLLNRKKILKHEAPLEECLLMGTANAWNNCNCAYYSTSSNVICFEKRPNIGWLRILYG